MHTSVQTHLHIYIRVFRSYVCVHTCILTCVCVHTHMDVPNPDPQVCVHVYSMCCALGLGAVSVCVCGVPQQDTAAHSAALDLCLHPEKLWGAVEGVTPLSEPPEDPVCHHPILLDIDGSCCLY